MIGFLFALALHFKSRKTEGRVNLHYMQVIYCVIQYVHCKSVVSSIVHCVTVVLGQWYHVPYLANQMVLNQFHVIQLIG